MQPKIVVSLETSTYPPCPPTKFDLSRTCWVKFVNFHLVRPSSSDGQYVLIPRHLAWQEIFPLGFLILHSFLPVKQPVDFGQFHKVKDKHRTHGRDSIILPLHTRVPQVVKQQQQPVANANVTRIDGGGWFWWYCLVCVIFSFLMIKMMMMRKLKMTTNWLHVTIRSTNFRTTNFGHGSNPSFQTILKSKCF